MAYRYRCDRCRVAFPTVPTRAAAEQERAQHRLAHGGHVPDHVEYVGAGLDPATRRWLALVVAGGTAMAVWNWVHGR
ncbi:hypothetical protein AB0B15_42975 [Streptomyces sp. NPDC045456]|uniref:hypothetical protein n=1 Tax=Streptomyces sp. NPDC045456 TaxID=3155254 RepID=UPI0033F67F76